MPVRGQLAKMPSSIVGAVAPSKVTVVRALQAKAAYPMDVTELGITMEVSALRMKAAFPMVSTDSGITREVRALDSKAPSPMVFTVPGISREVRAVL